MNIKENEERRTFKNLLELRLLRDHHYEALGFYFLSLENQIWIICIFRQKKSLLLKITNDALRRFDIKSFSVTYLNVTGKDLVSKSIKAWFVIFKSKLFRKQICKLTDEFKSSVFSTNNSSLSPRWAMLSKKRETWS